MAVGGRLCTSQVNDPSIACFDRFHVAAILVSAGQEDIVQELVGAGADVNGTNDKGLTPL